VQKILIMETYDCGLRSGAYGWSIECGASAERDINERITDTKHFNQVDVGLVGGPKGMSHTHPTPLHAIAKGWHLMAPPTKHVTEERDYFEWWFEKV
jgi:hypothetical protein